MYDHHLHDEQDWQSSDWQEGGHPSSPTTEASKRTEPLTFKQILTNLTIGCLVIFLTFTIITLVLEISTKYLGYW